MPLLPPTAAAWPYGTRGNGGGVPARHPNTRGWRQGQPPGWAHSVPGRDGMVVWKMASVSASADTEAFYVADARPNPNRAHSRCAGCVDGLALLKPGHLHVAQEKVAVLAAPRSTPPIGGEAAETNHQNQPPAKPSQRHELGAPPPGCDATTTAVRGWHPYP